MNGAAAVLVASERHDLKPLARIVGGATAGVQPRIMGIGPVNATQRLLAKTKPSIDEFDVIELNEAFAAQTLACLQELGMPDDADHVNPNGDAIALGHPLSVRPLAPRVYGVARAARALNATGALHDVHGVGQEIAAILEAA